MKNKIFLASILLTPILVVVASSLYFSYGISSDDTWRDNTKNHGVFFKSYFEFNQFNKNEKETLIEFEDGKWVMAVYITKPNKAVESLKWMRRLNVALNRDINRVKRVAFYSNALIEEDVNALLKEYPRTDLINDKNGILINVLQRNSFIDMNEENPIFIIDPYGRAVMYFEPSTDKVEYKKILKDLKVLI